MHRPFIGFGAFLFAVTLTGCGKDSYVPAADAGPGEPDAAVALDIPPECNPLVPQACLLPWPSAVYLEEDSGTATGLRLALPETAMPVNRDGVRVEPIPYNRRDGFGIMGPITVAFPEGVSAEGLPPESDIGASLLDDSPIVLLDMDRGERHPFFAEVDQNPFTNTPGRRALLIRPVVALMPSTRYAVAIRVTVKDAAGEDLPRSPAFAAILAGETPDHPRAAAIAPRYDEIFAALAQAGIEREELVLAWDFVTASDASLTADLLAMRDQALEALSSGQEIGYELDEVDDDDGRTLRFLTGTFEAPNFLTSGEDDDSHIIRGDDDLPALTGVYRANLNAIVPACVETAELPIPITILGHGIFGSSRQELRSDPVRNFAEDHCTVVLGSDWIGLTVRQAVLAVLIAGNVNRLPQLTEKLAQSVINVIALVHAARGPLVDEPLLQRDGEPILDPDRMQFYGLSLGGIMGGVFMAYEPTIERGALGVGGGAWSLLLERSDAWIALQAPIINAYGDQLTYQTLLALFSLAFEPYDPVATARRVLDDPLPGVPPKQLFYYKAVGDTAVTNVATHMLARTMGLPLTGPSVMEPFGFEITTEPVPSGLTIYDEKPEPFPAEGNVPPQENSTHVEVRNYEAVSRQLAAFFGEGEVRHACELDGEPAPCDCTVGACSPGD
jgi:hypothetical protein